MNDEQLQKEFIEFLSEQLQAKDQKDLEQKVKQLDEEKLTEYYNAFVEYKKNKKVKAQHGAKLNYLKKLKNQCADDEELVYFRKGGKVDCGCAKKASRGTSIDKKQTPSAETFKKMKKEKDGAKLCPKCGKVHKAGMGCSVNKKFQKGGEISFFQQGTPKGGVKKRVWRFRNEEVRDLNSPYPTSMIMTAYTEPDEFGRTVEITRQISPKRGTMHNDTTYMGYMRSPQYGYNFNDPKTETPRDVVDRNFSTWKDYFNYLLALKNKQRK